MPLVDAIRTRRRSSFWPYHRVKPSDFIDALYGGRCEAMRRRTTIMWISSFYADESGGIDTRSFVMGGYIASMARWKKFADDWQRALDKPPAIPPLHMVEFEGMSGDYSVLDDGSAERKLQTKKLLRLVSVIEKHKLTAFTVQWLSRYYKQHVRGNLPQRWSNMDTPHAWGCLVLLGEIARCNPIMRFDPAMLECVFDHHQAKLQVEKAYETQIRPQLIGEMPQLAGMGARWINPNERAKYPALQAADCLVWHLRRARDYGDGKARPAFKRLKAVSDIRDRSIGGEDMRRWIAEGYGI